MRLFVVIFCLLLVMPFASAPAQEGQGARELVVEAVVLMRRAQATDDLAQSVEFLQEAHDRLKRVIEHHPDSDAAARLKSGEGVVVLGEPPLTLERVAVLLQQSIQEACQPIPNLACLSDMALAAARNINNNSSRANVLVRVAAALAQAGDIEAAREIGAQALAVALNVKDPLRRVRNLTKVGIVLTQAGEVDTALTAVSAIEHADLMGLFAMEIEASRAYVLREVAVAQARAGDTEAARETAALAHAAALKIEDDNSRANMLVAVAAAQARAGDIEAARETAASAIKDDDSRVSALAPVVAHLVKAGYIEVAQAGDIEAALATASAIENASSRASALESVAITQVEAGDIEAALVTASAIENAWSRAYALAIVAKAQATAGDIDAARETGAQAHAAALKIEDDNSRANVLVRVAAALAQAGDIEAALTAASTIENAMARAPVLVAVAAAQALAGDIEAARETGAQAHAAVLEI